MDLLRSIFKGDKVIWIIFLFLCLISIVEVFSAASTLTYKSGDHWGPITQHSIILMVGAVVVVFMHNIPYKWFQVFPVFLLPLSVVLLGLVMMMERINGAARWMTFMGIQFQPSEVAKMAVIIVTAFILSKGQDEDGASPKAFKRIMIITGVVCLLIRVGRIAKKCDRTFPAFLIIGIALLLVSQAVFNMMVAVGLAPVTGQPLPLISKGGTSTLINCAYIGMILSVSRYTAKLEEIKEHDAQIPMQVEAAVEEGNSEIQTAAEPTAKVLNSDAEFE